MTHGRSADSGFTLLEVLVVMTLLSLLVLAMGSALRSTAQVEQRVDERLAQNDEMRVTVGFLRDVLGRVSLVRSTVPAGAAESPYSFAGEPQAVRWLGVMPARHGVGGRHHFQLSIEPQGLVLRYAPWRGDRMPDWSAGASQVLVPHATALAMRYEDASQQPAQWVDRWTVLDALPERVVVSLQTDHGPWPDLAVRMRPMAQNDPSLANRAVFGGSSSGRR